MEWTDIEWHRLKALREYFLSENPADSAKSGHDYWNSELDLAHYDLTFAQRIGWKWQSVLRDLKNRKWHLPADADIYDWGCGTGIAARTFLEFFGEDFQGTLHLGDRSKRAVDFAMRRCQARFPKLKINSPAPHPLVRPTVLLLSHVMNELPASALTALWNLILMADTVIWLEPGTSAISKKMSEQHELFLKKKWQIIGPCTHQQGCGMLTDANARNWCHHFATPPKEIFMSKEWFLFSKQLNIDLRSLPVSYLAAEKNRELGPAPELSGATVAHRDRIIGRPRVYKGFAKVLLCGGPGSAVRELDLQKRVSKELFKEMGSCHEGEVYSVDESAGKITRAKRIL